MSQIAAMSRGRHPHALFSLPRFRVLLEMIKPDRPDSTISLKGLDYVDVSGLATKDYKVSFFTYKEGLCNAKVRHTDNRHSKSA